MSERYIKNNFDKIIKFASIIENRKCDEVSIQGLLSDNEKALYLAKTNGLDHLLIDGEYEVDIEI